MKSWNNACCNCPASNTTVHPQILLRRAATWDGTVLGEGSPLAVRGFSLGTYLDKRSGATTAQKKQLRLHSEHAHARAFPHRHPLAGRRGVASKEEGGQGRDSGAFGASARQAVGEGSGATAGGAGGQTGGGREAVAHRAAGGENTGAQAESGGTQGVALEGAKAGGGVGHAVSDHTVGAAHGVHSMHGGVVRHGMGPGGHVQTAQQQQEGSSSSVASKGSSSSRAGEGVQKQLQPQQQIGGTGPVTTTGQQHELPGWEQK